MMQYLEKGLLYMMAFLGCFFCYEFYSGVRSIRDSVIGQNVTLVELKADVRELNNTAKYNKETLQDIEGSALYFASIDRVEGKDGVTLNIIIPSGMKVGVNGVITDYDTERRGLTKPSPEATH